MGKKRVSFTNVKKKFAVDAARYLRLLCPRSNFTSMEAYMTAYIPAQSNIHNCTNNQNNQLTKKCSNTSTSCFQAYAKPLCNNTAYDPKSCFTHYVQKFAEMSEQVFILKKSYEQALLDVVWQDKNYNNFHCIGSKSYDTVYDFCKNDMKNTSKLEKCYKRIQLHEQWCKNYKDRNGYTFFNRLNYISSMCRSFSLQMTSKCIHKHKKYYEVRHCFGNIYFDTYTRCIQKNLNTNLCNGMFLRMVCPKIGKYGTPKLCYQEYLENVKKTCLTDYNNITHNKSNKNLYWLFLLILIPLVGGVICLYYYQRRHRQFRVRLINPVE